MCILGFCSPMILVLWVEATVNIKIVQTPDRARAYGTEVSTKKSKIMTNKKNGINADTTMNGLKLEGVTSLNYLEATLCKYSTCPAEICIRIT